MASGTVDNASLPAVREAQGELTRAIFDHPAFDQEGQRMYGKLFYVFEETIQTSEMLEMAHLGEDAEGASRAALQSAIDANDKIVSDHAGSLFELAKQKYKDKDLSKMDDVDLGDRVRLRAKDVRDAAAKTLAQEESMP